MNTPILTLAQSARLHDLQINPAKVPLRKDPNGTLELVHVEGTDIRFYHIDPAGNVLYETLNDLGDGWSYFRLDQEEMGWTEIEDPIFDAEVVEEDREIEDLDPWTLDLPATLEVEYRYHDEVDEHISHVFVRSGYELLSSHPALPDDEILFHFSTRRSLLKAMKPDTFNGFDFQITRILGRVDPEEVEREAGEGAKCGCTNDANCCADGGERHCEWCHPHEHEELPEGAQRHDFTVNMLCRNCRFLAQDCCESASACTPTR